MTARSRFSTEEVKGNGSRRSWDRIPIFAGSAGRRTRRELLHPCRPHRYGAVRCRQPRRPARSFPAAGTARLHHVERSIPGRRSALAATAWPCSSIHFSPDGRRMVLGRSRRQPSDPRRDRRQARYSPGTGTRESSTRRRSMVTVRRIASSSRDGNSQGVECGKRRAHLRTFRGTQPRRFIASPSLWTDAILLPEDSTKRSERGISPPVTRSDC